jgi:hypothetical protein
MKKELSEIARTESAHSRDLLNRSKAIVSELQQTVERSRNLLEESYRLMDRLKIRPVLEMILTVSQLGQN